MSIDIRPAAIADISLVSDLAKQTIELHGLEEKDWSYWDASYLQRSIESPNCLFLTAWDGDHFAGFVMAKMLRELNEAYLEDIALVPDERSKGAGHALFKACLDGLRALEIKEVWLIVHEDNLHMQQIMQHYGVTKGRKFYFYGGKLAELSI